MIIRSFLFEYVRVHVCMQQALFSHLEGALRLAGSLVLFEGITYKE